MLTKDSRVFTRDGHREKRSKLQTQQKYEERKKVESKKIPRLRVKHQSKYFKVPSAVSTVITNCISTCSVRTARDRSFDGMKRQELNMFKRFVGITDKEASFRWIERKENMVDTRSDERDYILKKKDVSAEIYIN